MWGMPCSVRVIVAEYDGVAAVATGVAETAGPFEARIETTRAPVAAQASSRVCEVTMTPQLKLAGSGYGLARTQRPFQTGARFSANAIGPSMASSLVNTRIIASSLIAQ